MEERQRGAVAEFRNSSVFLVNKSCATLAALLQITFSGSSVGCFFFVFFLLRSPEKAAFGTNTFTAKTFTSAQDTAKG